MARLLVVGHRARGGAQPLRMADAARADPAPSSLGYSGRWLVQSLCWRTLYGFLRTRESKIAS
jgi:hypothetical protein